MTNSACIWDLKMTLRHIIATISVRFSNGKRHARSALLMAGLLVLLPACSTTQRVKDTSHTFRTVVIDAGHGGHDNGTRSRWAGSEKDAALDVARRLEPKLREAGFKTVMTRNTDRFIPLDTRSKISNKQRNAIFVSIHFNEAPRQAVSGTELYYKSPESRALAQVLLKNVASVPGASSRGVRTANFHVLRVNNYPAVLVECGYFSNPSEGGRCATPAYRERLADAIADGVFAQRFNGPRIAKASAPVPAIGLQGAVASTR